MPADSSVDSLERLHVEKINMVYETTGCGRMEARTALEKRAWHVECAIEYVQRTGLAAVMSDARRYPLWTKLQADDAEKHNPLWRDEEFLGYVELHSETDRGLFHAHHILRLYALACTHPPALREGGWCAMHEDVAVPLVKRAREHLKSLTFRALAPQVREEIALWRPDGRAPGGFNEYVEAITLARRGNLVAVDPDIEARVEYARQVEVQHCRKVKDLCTLHDCACHCVGCDPKSALADAKIALADAVLAELAMIKGMDVKTRG